MRTRLFLLSAITFAVLAGCTKERGTVKNEPEQAEKYAVEVSSSEGGTATVVVGKEAPATEAETEKGTRVTLSAQADELYRFDSWVIESEDVTFDTTKADVAFDMPERDVAVKANFVLNAGALYIKSTPGGEAGSFEVSANGEPVESGALVEVGATLTVKAVATEEYEFINWEIEGVDIPDADKTKTEVSFAMPEESVTIDGEFKTTHYLLTVTKLASTAGTVEVKVDGEAWTSGSRIKAGKTVSVKATPTEKYNFGHWVLESGDAAFEDENAAETTFVMPEGSVMITAYWDAIEVPTAHLIVGGTPGGASGRFEVTAGGEIVDNDLIEVGTLLTAKAVAAEGYKFSEWAITGVTLPDADKTKAEITFAMPNNVVNVNGNFKATSFVLNLGTTSGAAGTVEAKVDGEMVPSGTKVEAGKIVYLKCTPTEKYNFGHWVVNSGDVVFENENAAETTFVMPEERVSLYASYASKPTARLTVIGSGGMYGSFVVTTGDGTTLSSSSSVQVGTMLTVKAVDNDKYAFGKWNITGYTVPENLMNTNEITFAMPANEVTIRANYVQTHFALLLTEITGKCTVEMIVDGESTIFTESPKPDPYVKAGASVTLKCTPDETRTFNKWEDNRSLGIFGDLTSPEITFIMPAENAWLGALTKVK